MKKKLFILLTLVFLVIISTGCSYRELNDLAISTVLGIDYIPSKDEYKVTAQVFDFSKTDSNNVNEGIIVYAGEGKTIAKAIRNIYLKYPQVLHLGHLQLLILGKDVIKDETNTIFDYFLRSPETSSDCYVMISQDGTAYEILASNNKPEDAFNAKELLKNAESNELRQGTATMVNLEEFLSLKLQKGIDPVITTIKYTKNNEDDHSSTYITGLSAFKENVITEELSDNASLAYNIINNSFSDVMIDSKYKDSNLAILLLSPASKVKLELEDDEVNVSIKIETEGHISEIHKDVGLLNDQILKELKDDLARTLKSYIEELLDFCKEEEVDILGLKNTIYKKFNKEYEKFEEVNIYEKANFNIDVTTYLFRHGTIYNGAIGG